MVSEKFSVSQQVLVSESNIVPARRSLQYLAAVIATLGGLIAGTCLGWTSPVETSLEKGDYGFPVSKDEFAWIGSFMPLGAILGSVITASLVDFVGRKNLILLLTTPCIIGWLSMAFSVSVVMFCIGRFLTGIAVGSYCILAPMYTAEIAEKEIRGTLGTYLQLQITIGILFIYSVGSLVSVFTLTIVCALFPCLYFLLMLFVPETPYFHIMKQNLTEAQRSLSVFRGPSYDGRQEMAVMQKSVADDAADKVPFMQAFQTTAAKRGLVIGLGVMFLQQFSGCNAVIFYTKSIFEDAGALIDPGHSTIIVGVIQVIATWVASLVVDRLGRRMLLLLSIIVMTLSTFTLGLYFYLKNDAHEDVSDIGWLPLLSLSCYVVIFSLGFGPIPWMLMAEIFPSKIKGAACSFACFFNWICTFIVTKLFPVFTAEFGTGMTFWCFTACSAFGILFVMFLVPETKGKTLSEVQEILSGRSELLTPRTEYAVNEAFAESKVKV